MFYLMIFKLQITNNQFMNQCNLGGKGLKYNIGYRFMQISTCNLVKTLAKLLIRDFNCFIFVKDSMLVYILELKIF